MFINWYKLAQLSNIEVIEDRKEPYTEIGHGIKGPNEGFPNYIWILIEGEVISKEQTSKFSDHITAFPEYLNVNGAVEGYGGRFESSTGRLTIFRPVRGFSEFRSVPKSILFKLYQKFPRIKQIYVY